jgi:colanic acid biosynthesis glycosyl transferase WcaI
MHILLLAQHFAPEEVSGAVLATELATDLVSRGHRVTFVTCAPNYPQGQLFPGYQNRLYSKEDLSGVEVIRTWSFISPSKGFWPRLLNYGSFSATAFYGGLLALKPDVIFSYSPPLPLGLSAWLLSRRWQVPWLLRVEDLYPDAAIAAGVLRHRPVIKLFYGLEKFLYRQASHISVISDSFRQNLLAKDVPPDKLSVTPVWADPDSVRPLPKYNGFRQAHGLDGQFLVMYAGNLGHASALDEVLATADLLRHETGIKFVFIGEGVKKEKLMATAAKLGLPNVSFLPFQPRHLFPEMLAAADVGLVTLNQNASGTSLPSKTFNIMASGRPILAVTSPTSEIARLVQQARCGVNVAPNQPQQLADEIVNLKRDQALLAQLGHNGRRELEINFSRRGCVDQYEQLLRQMANKS